MIFFSYYARGSPPEHPMLKMNGSNGSPSPSNTVSIVINHISNVKYQVQLYWFLTIILADSFGSAATSSTLIWTSPSQG